MAEQDTAIFYYCYGNASPIDIEYNPIPSIATIRQFNTSIPIVVMTCENNDHYYLPYMRQLNFKLHKFAAKHATNQLCYKPTDTFALLEKTDFEKAVVCDTDIMWTRSIDEMIRLWDKSTKDYFIQDAGNTGVFGISRRGDPVFRQNWCDLSEILAQSDTKALKDILIKYYNSTNVVNEEVSLSIIRTINTHTGDSIEYYDNDLFCRPHANKYTNESFGLHYDTITIEKLFREQYHFTTKMRVGRVGLLLSIKEYRDIVERLLGRCFGTFMRYIPVLHEQYTLEEFLQKVNAV